jgi:hypothetical protein
MDFYSELALYINSQDLHNANKVIMKELAVCLVKQKSNFIEVLRNANILVPDNTTDSQLVSAFVDNAPCNRRLLLGAAFLIMKNQSSFDGNSELSNLGTKATYKVLYEYFDANQYEDESDMVNDDYYNVEDFADDEFYNVGGIGGIIKSGLDVSGKIIEGQQKKKFGNSDTLAKQQESKAQMLKSVLKMKENEQNLLLKEKEMKDKKTKTILIVAGSIVAVGLIIGVIYAIKKNKK